MDIHLSQNPWLLFYCIDIRWSLQWGQHCWPGIHSWMQDDLWWRKRVQLYSRRKKIGRMETVSAKWKIKKWLKHIFFLRTVLGIHIKISVGRLIISELSFADFRFCVKVLFFTWTSLIRNYDESVALCLCCCIGVIRCPRFIFLWSSVLYQ